MKLNEKIKDKITNEILGIPKNRTDDEISSYIDDNRPIWAKELDRMNNLF